MIFCEPDDAKELSDMARDIWTEYYNTIVTGDNIDYFINTIQTEKAIRQQIQDGCRYSFITEGEIKAGYFCIVPQGDSLFISKFYLYKEFRGKGLGSDTMDEILNMGRALKMKDAYLLVNRNNINSIEIYKHKGFIIAREEMREVGDGYYMDDYRLEYYF